MERVKLIRFDFKNIVWTETILISMSPGKGISSVSKSIKLKNRYISVEHYWCTQAYQVLQKNNKLLYLLDPNFHVSCLVVSSIILSYYFKKNVHCTKLLVVLLFIPIGIRASNNFSPQFILAHLSTQCIRWAIVTKLCLLTVCLSSVINIFFKMHLLNLS